MDVGDRGENHVDRWEAVMPNPCELALGVDRTALDSVVDRDLREREELLHQFGVFPSVACRVTGFEQNRQARCNPSLFEKIRNLMSSELRERVLIKPAQAELSSKGRGFGQSVSAAICRHSMRALDECSTGVALHCPPR